MPVLRRRLSWLVGAWLTCQVVSAFVAPAALVAAGALADVCTCPGATPGQVCPMHGSHGETPRDGSRCVIGGVAAPDAMLLSLLGNLGVIPIVRSLAFALPVAATPASRVSPPLTRPDIPDPPPPRA